MLQFITHKTERFDEIEGARLALEGGCRWIQLRMKDAPVEEVIAKGKSLVDITRSYGAKLIIDDHVELVDEIGADGVHLGKNDMPVAEARAVLENTKIIGATANTFSDIIAAVKAGADYIGLGPYRFTQTKKKLSPVLGIGGYMDIMLRYDERELTIPVVAIGGITDADVAVLMSTGIAGIAVSGTILNAQDPVEATRKLLAEIENVQNE